MNVRPWLTCRPIDKAMGQLSRIWIWRSPSSLVYTRNASVENCGPPPVVNIPGLCSAFIHGSTMSLLKTWSCSALRLLMSWALQGILLKVLSCRMNHCSRCCFSNLIIIICNWWNQCGKNRNRQFQEHVQRRKGFVAELSKWLPSFLNLLALNVSDRHSGRRCSHSCWGCWTALGAVGVPFSSLAWLFARVFERLTPFWVVFQELWVGFSSSVWSRVTCMMVTASISKFAKACSMPCTGRLLCALSCYRTRGNRLGNRSSFLLLRSSSLLLFSSRQS